MEFCVLCAGNPMARRTCEGSSVPDEHADPVETAMPSRSSAISSDLGFDAVEADVRCVRDAPVARAVDGRVRNCGQDLGLQTVPQGRQARRLPS